MNAGTALPPLRATRLLDQVRERLRYAHCSLSLAPIEEPGKHRQRHPRRGVNAPRLCAALPIQRKLPAEREVLRCDGSPRSERQHNEAGQVGKYAQDDPT